MFPCLNCNIMLKFNDSSAAIEKFVLKQSDNQYATAVLIAEQLSILTFWQDDHLGNVAYYDCFTTMVEIAHQAGVCYYSPALLEDKAIQLK